MNEETKVCSKCGGEKLLGEFHKTQYWCKVCKKEYDRRYYKENREHSLELGRQWREDNAGYARRYYQEHKAKRLVQARQWRQANPEKRAVVERRWRRANLAKCAAKLRRWRRTNPEKAASIERRWRKANPEKCTAQWHRYRARKAGNGGTYTVEEWQEVCELYGNCCACCGKKTKLAVDHIIPISMGGTSDIVNIQPLCRSCNSKKGTKAIHYLGRPTCVPG